MDRDDKQQSLRDKIEALKRRISKHKQAEDAIIKERDIISKVLYWIDSLVVVIDLEGYIVIFNRASEKLSGYRFEEVRSKPFWNILLTPEEREGVRDTIKDVIHKELPRTSQNYWVTKSGEKRLISCVNSLLTKPDGTIEYILCTGLDITEQQKAEEALKESEAKYRELVQMANSIIMRLDTRGYLTFFNEYAERFFGYKEAEILGKNAVGTIIPVTDSMGRELDTLITDIIKHPDQYTTHENENMRRNGDRVWMAWTNKAIYDRQGKVTGVLCIGNDITERKRLELQLQHAQKMEAVGTLAGGVAHDLNNILSGLVSYPELIMLDLPANDPLRADILKIKESGENAAAIVQDLLTLARRGVIINEVLNLNDIISDFLKTPEYKKLRDLHEHIDFKVNLESELLNILGSPVHLSKTIMNLVSNGAEAIADTGTVTIGTENRYIDRPVRGYEDVQEGDYALLSVSDSGVGIQPDDLVRIFEPFFTKKEMGRSGTGLGMAVVWGTVKDHNGYIDVQSQTGQGTRCELYFPVTRREKTNGKTTVSIEKCKGHEKILVVDDIEEQREIARQMLAKLGYDVTVVSSGEEAVAHMQNNTVDLIVLDMIMEPGIDGLETYERILAYHPGQKAIVTSGYSETNRVKKALHLGAGAYIKKPYVLQKIGLAVRNELDS